MTSHLACIRTWTGLQLEPKYPSLLGQRLLLLLQSNIGNRESSHIHHIPQVSGALNPNSTLIVSFKELGASQGLLLLGLIGITLFKNNSKHLLSTHSGRVIVLHIY